MKSVYQVIEDRTIKDFIQYSRTIRFQDEDLHNFHTALETIAHTVQFDLYYMIQEVNDEG